MKDKTAIALIKEVQDFDKYSDELFKVGMELRYFSGIIEILVKEYGIPKELVGDYEGMASSLDKDIRSPKRIVRHMKYEGLKHSNKR